MLSGSNDCTLNCSSHPGCFGRCWLVEAEVQNVSPSGPIHHTDGSPGPVDILNCIRLEMIRDQRANKLLELGGGRLVPGLWSNMITKTCDVVDLVFCILCITHELCTNDLGIICLGLGPPPTFCLCLCLCCNFWLGCLILCLWLGSCFCLRFSFWCRCWLCWIYIACHWCLGHGLFSLGCFAPLSFDSRRSTWHHWCVHCVFSIIIPTFCFRLGAAAVGTDDVQLATAGSLNLAAFAPFLSAFLALAFLVFCVLFSFPLGRGFLF